MYLQRSPYAPVVTHELDTQNFEHFDEEARGMSGSGAKRWARADPNFIGYTYKSYEAVQPSDGRALSSIWPDFHGLSYPMAFLGSPRHPGKAVTNHGTHRIMNQQSHGFILLSLAGAPVNSLPLPSEKG